MMRWILSLLLTCFCCHPAYAGPIFDGRSQLPRLERHLDRGLLAQDYDRSLDNLVSAAARILRERDMRREAAELESDWRPYSGFLVAHLWTKDLGSHAPWSLRLAQISAKLEQWLGPELMHWTRLEDLATFNYGVPVTLHFDSIDGAEIDSPEYALHFVPVAGAAAYWVTWGVCQGGTAGSGWVLICMPAGMLAEYSMEKYIAPRYSDQLYARFYEGQGHPLFDGGRPIWILDVEF